MSICRQENPKPQKFFIASTSTCTFTTQREGNTIYTRGTLGTEALEWSSETIRAKMGTFSLGTRNLKYEISPEAHFSYKYLHGPKPNVCVLLSPLFARF